MYYQKIALFSFLLGEVLAQTPQGITPATSKPLSAVYSGNTTFTPGQLLTKTLVATQPSVFSHQVLNGTYTLLMIDPDASANGSAATVLHWLQTDLTVSNVASNQIFPLENSQDVSALAPYISPSPPLQNPPHPHHYTFLLFSQPNGTPLKITSDLNKTLTSRIGFDLTSFVQNTGVGPLVAATFFQLVNTTSTSANGTSTTPSSSPTSMPNSFQWNGVRDNRPFAVTIINGGKQDFGEFGIEHRASYLRSGNFANNSGEVDVPAII
ncbi:hypothetical protein B7463_g9000, partial [Scytalidium lignicola]